MTYGRESHSRWAFLQQLKRKNEKHVRANQGNIKLKISGRKTWCALPNQKLSGIFFFTMREVKSPPELKLAAQKHKSWSYQLTGRKMFLPLLLTSKYSCINVLCGSGGDLSSLRKQPQCCHSDVNGVISTWKQKIFQIL